jgi:hypothetical protein
MLRIGAYLSLTGAACFGASVSLVDFCCLGASMALRNVCSLGASLATYSCATVETLAVKGLVSLGSRAAVSQSLVFGASVAVRSFARLGASIAVVDSFSMQSSLALRCFSQLGSSLSVNGEVFAGRIRLIPKNGTYTGTTGLWAENDHEVRLEAGGQRGITVFSTGGQFHGTWIAQNAVSVSDRRLKTNIRELASTLQNRSMGRQAGDGPLWILRQMRPVSYNFREGFGNNMTRFGFVADELQQVLPEVVRAIPQRMMPNSSGGGVLSVAYQDLIAVLAVALKTQLEAVEQQQVVIEKQRGSLAERRLVSAQLSLKIEGMEAQLKEITREVDCSLSEETE